MWDISWITKGRLSGEEMNWNQNEVFKALLPSQTYSAMLPSEVEWVSHARDSRQPCLRGSENKDVILIIFLPALWWNMSLWSQKSIYIYGRQCKTSSILRNRFHFIDSVSAPTDYQSLLELPYICLFYVSRYTLLQQLYWPIARLRCQILSCTNMLVSIDMKAAVIPCFDLTQSKQHHFTPLF